MALSPGATAIGQCPQALVQVFHLGAAQRDTLHRRAPGRRKLGGAQQRAGTPMQGVDEHLLGLAVGAVAPVVARKPARATQRLPVGGAVTSAGEPRGIDEGLGQQQRMAVNALPITREAAQIQPQHPRGQIGHLCIRQDQEAGIVDQQMQALVVQHSWPADPGIARGALERRRLPTEQSKPAPIGNGDIPQRLAEQRTQAEGKRPF